MAATSEHRFQINERALKNHLDHAGHPLQIKNLVTQDEFRLNAEEYFRRALPAPAGPGFDTSSVGIRDLRRCC